MNSTTIVATTILLALVVLPFALGKLSLAIANDVFDEFSQKHFVVGVLMSIFLLLALVLFGASVYSFQHVWGAILFGSALP